MICNVCATDVAPGKKFCTLCGAAMPEDIPTSESEQFQQPLQAPEQDYQREQTQYAQQQTFQQPPVQPPYDVAFQQPYSPDAPDAYQYGAQTFEPAQYAPPQPMQPPAPQIPTTTIATPGVDADLIENILQEDEAKQRKRQMGNKVTAIFTTPELWFSLGALLLIPSLFLPWIVLFPSRALGAFQTPLWFLASGEQGAAWLSTGVVLSTLAAASVILIVWRNRIMTLLRAIAAACILLALFALLFTFRSWTILSAGSYNYADYLVRQVKYAENVSGKTKERNRPAPDKEVLTESLKKVKSEGGLNFVRKMLGVGALFSFLGGLALLVATYRFAKSGNFLSAYMAPGLSALLVIILTGFAVFLALRLIFPVQWYTLTSGMYKTLGLLTREEANLKKCMALPLPDPPLSCEAALGRLWYVTNRKEQAINLFKEISHEHPEFSGVDNYLGNYYFERQDYVNAEHHLRKYLKDYPGDSSASHKLASALSVMALASDNSGDYDTAIKELKEARELNPALKNDISITTRLAELLEKKGDAKKSSEYYGRAADLDPTDFKLQFQAARMYEIAGDYDKAVAYYEKCANAEFDPFECCIHAGDVYHSKLNDDDTARQWYEKRMEINSVSDGADTARKKLKEME